MQEEIQPTGAEATESETSSSPARMDAGPVLPEANTPDPVLQDGQAGPAPKKRASRSRARRGKSALAAEVPPTHQEDPADEAGSPLSDAEPDAPRRAAEDTPSVSPKLLLSQLAEREVVESGEPIPLLGRDSLPAEPVMSGEMVLVPEAEAVLPEEEDEPLLTPEIGDLTRLGDLLLELPSVRFRDPGTRAEPLPPITPELLAEVRGVTPEEVQRERAAEARREETAAPARPPVEARKPGRSRGPETPLTPPLPAPTPAQPAPESTGPFFVLVPEALLETAPEDWIEDEEALIDEAAPEPSLEAPGRRRRRRRDRGRREVPEEETVQETVAAPAPLAPERPAPVLLRAEDDTRSRDRRDREAAEPRAEREYKEILINVDDRELRIAVLEAGKLVELHVEREERVVGSVYKGRVSNVLPGMDAAFVDIGLDRNAFLYVGDILFEEQGRSGGGDSSVRRTSRDVRIKDLAKPGQEMLLQVVKGPRGTKGARVSTKISIPGRYLVLMPDSDSLGVSRKIEDVRERDRLKRIADQLQPKGFGLIVRTEAEGRPEAELEQDLDYLVGVWRNIQEKNKRVQAPAVIHKDLGTILKTIRDLFGSDVDRLVIDDVEEYEKAREALSQLAPDLVDRLSLYDEPEPLFIRYHLEEEIDRLLRRKVWLRNGAYLLVDTTEALTTFDVNTGKFVGTSSLAETILKTNLDAVDEIARQLRLRDIGGMIVLDFIDMASSRDRQLVMRALENALKKDRTRIKIAHISPLGLVEMTRKRTAEAVTDVMSHTCPYCQGRGRVWSPETVAIQVEREIKRRCATQEIDAILVYAHPDVAEQLVGPEGECIERLERMLRRPVYVRGRHDYHQEKWEVVPGDMLELEQQMLPYHGGQVVECLVTKSELITPPRSAAWADGYFVDLANGARLQGQTIRVRLTDVRRSFALGEPVAPHTAVDRSEPI